MIVTSLQNSTRSTGCLDTSNHISVFPHLQMRGLCLLCAVWPATENLLLTPSTNIVIHTFACQPFWKARVGLQCCTAAFPARRRLRVTHP